MQEDQTSTPSQLTVEDVAARYVAGSQLTHQELAIIQNNRAATEEFITIVKRLLAKEAYSLRSFRL
jgi:hypothetical protein